MWEPVFHALHTQYWFPPIVRQTGGAYCAWVNIDLERCVRLCVASFFPVLVTEQEFLP